MLNRSIRTILAERDSLSAVELQAWVETKRENGAQPITIDALVTYLQQPARHLVIGVGAGVDKETMPQIWELSKRLNCEVVGTRPAADMGLVSHEAMVGQTGRSISVDSYIAFGISGDKLHTVGISQSTEIIAINIDSNAALCHKADRVLIENVAIVVKTLLNRL